MFFFLYILFSGCSNALCPFEQIAANCESFRDSDGKTKKCEFGMRFDKMTHQCVEFQKAACAQIECQGMERKNSPISCSEYLQCNSQQWSTKHCSWIWNEFDMTTRECVFGWWGHNAKCRYDPADCTDGTLTPVKGDCRKYLSCQSHTQQTNSCMWPKKFDKISSQCVWWGATCY